MGSWDREDMQQGGSWSTGVGEEVAGRVGQARWRIADWVVPHSHADKPGGTTGERDRPCNPGLQCREIKPQSL